MKFSGKATFISLIILVLLTIILIWVTNHYILTLDFYANSGDPVAGISSQQKQTFENLQQWIYFSAAVYLFIKLAIIALILYTVLYLADHQVRFRGVLQVAISAEAVFFIPAVAKIIFFHNYCVNCTLSEWHKYYIGSALTIFTNAPADWNYALQTINIFEFTYWFVLAYGIKMLANLTFDQSLQIVLRSYVPALAIWIAAVTFFTLMMFPSTG